MTIQELDNKKAELLNKAAELSQMKNILYSNMDIESPMSVDEKELNNKIASIYSEINTIIIEKRKIKIA
jgi:hypothetical protein